jgi:hypothetical protein
MRHSQHAPLTACATPVGLRASASSSPLGNPVAEVFRAYREMRKHLAGRVRFRNPAAVQSPPRCAATLNSRAPPSMVGMLGAAWVGAAWVGAAWVGAAWVRVAHMVKCARTWVAALSPFCRTVNYRRADGSPVGGGAWSSLAGGPSSSVKIGFSASAHT